MFPFKCSPKQEKLIYTEKKKSDLWLPTAGRLMRKCMERNILLLAWGDIYTQWSTHQTSTLKI